MEKISNVFKRGKALITYISAGDPDLEMTKKIILTLDQAGVDVIELGIPFSDPLADGPVIQAAGQRALENGVTLSLILETVKEMKPLIQAPIVFMGYYNNIISYGQERFVQDVKEAGASGLIVPDLPYDEEPEFYELINEYGLAGILLVTPNTPEERLKEICRRSTGFLYCVSLLGVTGDRRGPQAGIKEYLQKVREYCPDLPLALGFGIDGPEKVKEVLADIDGIIIGSALINIISSYNTEEEILANISTFIKGIKEGLKAL